MSSSKWLDIRCENFRKNWLVIWKLSRIIKHTPEMHSSLPTSFIISQNSVILLYETNSTTMFACPLDLSWRIDEVVFIYITLLSFNHYKMKYVSRGIKGTIEVNKAAGNMEFSVIQLFRYTNWFARHISHTQFLLAHNMNP